MAGFKKEDMKVTLANNILTVQAEKKRDETTENANYKMRERSFGRVMRQLPLPFNTDETHITSKFENGVLCIDVPKSDSAQHTTKFINIQ